MKFKCKLRVSSPGELNTYKWIEVEAKSKAEVEMHSHYIEVKEVIKESKSKSNDVHNTRKGKSKSRLSKSV